MIRRRRVMKTLRYEKCALLAILRNISNPNLRSGILFFSAQRERERRGEKTPRLEEGLGLIAG